MKLSKQAQSIIDDYTSMQLGGQNVLCPYYNNKHAGVRAGLRVNIGKGSPKEIKEEAELVALKDKIQLNTLDQKALRVFLQKHNLGIECSGFVFHVLDAEMQARTGKTLKRHIAFPGTYNLLRVMIRKLRPVENTNVTILADRKNSHTILLEHVSPGDMIIMKGFTQGAGIRDHVLIVTEVDNNTITYAHSIRQSTDKADEHGVRYGRIIITDRQKPITAQQWIEQGKQGDRNKTWARAKHSRYCKIHRLNLLDEK